MSCPQRWIYATGTTTASVSLSDGVAPYDLVVIDRIIASMTLGAAGDITVAIDGATIASQAIAVESAATGALSHVININLGAGLPMWNASDSNLAPETTITVAVTGSGTPTLAKMWVLYHFEKPSARTL